MPGKLRATFLATLAAISISSVARSQQNPSDSLVRKIEVLERQLRELEQRVRELEARSSVEPSRDRPATSAGSRDLAKWRQLRRGMKAEQVYALLGEPDR